MSNLKSRLDLLERKLKSDNPDLPSCILLCVEDGRLNAPPDTSKIIRLTAHDNVYTREVDEEEETFISRAAKAEKELLHHRDAVPSLFCWTENIINKM